MEKTVLEYGDSECLENISKELVKANNLGDKEKVLELVSEIHSLSLFYVKAFGIDVGAKENGQ